MPPEEMTGSTHILEFMCYANSRFRRDKIPHGNGDDIFFRCFGSAMPGSGRAAPRRAPRFRGSGSRACRLPDWVLAAAGSSVVRAAVFGYSSNKFLRINEDGPARKR